MARLKVLFLTRKWPPAIGGMEAYSRELARELESRVALDLRALPGRANGRPPSTLAIIAFGIATAFNLLIEGTNAEIVHGGDIAIWPLVWIATLRRRAIRPILSAHGSDISLAYRKGIAARLYKLYVKLGVALLPTATVLANSHATARLCEDSGFSCPRVVPLATRVLPMEEAEPEPYILFVGRLIPSKGCAWFIREVLPKLNPALRFVVAGTVWNDDERRALDNPSVTFLGPKFGADLARLRAHATAIIVPNLEMGMAGFEGFGLAATEGAADGGVVLAADIHGIADAVRDGQTGFLLPAGNAEIWAAKIREICGWPLEQRAAFIERSRAIVARIYSWPRVADETLDAYRQTKTQASAALARTPVA